MTRTGDSERAPINEAAAFRQAMYAFLSSAFSQPPSAESLAFVCADEFLAEADAMGGRTALAEIRQWASGAASTDLWIQAACQEFMDLLKVPGSRYVAPYESVYRDAREVEGQPVRGLLMGQSALDVQKWYRLAALAISERYADLPDHAAMELAFLAHLCGKEQEFMESKDTTRLVRAREMERDFLAAHIVTWIGALKDKMVQNSDHPYFRGVADLTVDFTNRDLQTLENLLGPSKRMAAPASSRRESGEP